MNKWTIWHRYNQLIKDGKAKFIACPDCGNEMITRVRIHDDDTPYLWCFLCDIFLKPGLDIQDRVRAIVLEHYIL